MNTLSFGLPCHASWVQFPTKAKRVSFALSVPRMVNSLQGLAFIRQNCHASHVFANTLPARNRDLECKVTEHTVSPEETQTMEQTSQKSTIITCA